MAFVVDIRFTPPPKDPTLKMRRRVEHPSHVMRRAALISRMRQFWLAVLGCEPPWRHAAMAGQAAALRRGLHIIIMKGIPEPFSRHIAS